MDGFGFAVVALAIWLAACHVLPATLVAGSGRVRGHDLTLWFFAVLFTSWLGFVAFMVVTTMERQSTPDTRAPPARSRTPPVLDISDHSVR